MFFLPSSPTLSGKPPILSSPYLLSPSILGISSARCFINGRPKPVNKPHNLVAIVDILPGSAGRYVGMEGGDTVVKGVVLVDVGGHDALLTRPCLRVGEEFGFLARVVDGEQGMQVEDELAEGLGVGGRDGRGLEVDRVEGSDHDVVDECYFGGAVREEIRLGES